MKVELIDNVMCKAKSPDHGIRAILFDLDGVLVNTNNWHTRALNSTLEVLGYGSMSEHGEKIYDDFTTREMLEYLGFFDKHRIEHIMLQKEETVFNIMKKECFPNKRILNVINYALFHKYKTGVVTNVSKRTALRTLSLAGLRGLFDVVITGDDVNGKRKPSPYPYLLANEKLGLGRKQSLVIDDSGRGIISGVDAFCRTWWLKSQKALTVKSLERVINSYRITI